MIVVELVAGGLFALGGIRSLVVWSRRPFESPSLRDQVLYAMNLTGRIGLWFAFAGFFAGYALIEEPQRYGWYIMVPIGLGAVQFLSAFFLSRSTD